MLALSMVMQRYALSYPSENNKVPFFGVELPRMLVWFFGLVAYGIGCALYVISLLFAPLILMGSIFTTLLIWNMIFARWFLKEPLTAPKIACSTIILAGVCLIVVATPTGIPVDFSPTDVVALLSRPAGATYVAVLFTLVLSSVVAIIIYERTYPTNIQANSTANVIDVPIAADTKVSSSTEKWASPTAAPASLARNAEKDVDVEKAGDTKAAAAAGAATAGAATATVAVSTAIAPEWLDNFMGFLYPGSLGLDEGICSLTMKATISMLANCEGDECSMWIVWVSGFFWIVTSLATLWWLKTVFGRYEVTKALPIEYGAVNIASMCSGLLFFQEHRYLKSWQLSVVLSGLGVILVGLAVGRLDPPSSFPVKATTEDDVEMIAGMKPNEQIVAPPATTDAKR